jgi:hypothetical protein
LFESDPLNLRQYPRKYFKIIYTLVALALALMAFSLVFFLVYSMTPHGIHMRQYQKEIYEWNHLDMARTFAKYEFYFTVNNTAKFELVHQSQPYSKTLNEEK